ncbi:unnamed protein product [Parnassius mnemosyne]|uniref:PiggyBac transposable element-derived protein domain-containing protein n=1 Tax=Parnassius mnemosyne TaxID=213953 RepID=A0AAV1LP53_9NEOP
MWHKTIRTRKAKSYWSVLANANGLVCNFDVYQGVRTYPRYDNTTLGLGEKAVLNLVDDFLSAGHKLYFDRYFMTPRLARELKERDILCTGTIMKNRIPIAARETIKEDREMKREGRGSCQVLVNTSENMAITKWYDNKGVTMLSTMYAKDPTDTCARWQKSERRYIQIERPKVVQAYNHNMGGVDLADRMLSMCPYRYRTKKCTQRVFSHLIDLAASNAWILYKKDKLAEAIPVKKIQHLRDFKLELGENWIEKYTETSGSETQTETKSETDKDEKPKKREEDLQLWTSLHLKKGPEEPDICRK